MSILKSGASSNLARVGISAALALTAVGGLATASQATATQQAVSLSSLTGSVAGGNTLTLSLATSASPKFATGSVGVQFQQITSGTASTAACATNPALAAANNVSAATVGTDKLRFISTTKISVVVPVLSSVSAGTGYWLVCVYNTPSNGTFTALNATPTGFASTTATVIGKANYLSAAAPTVSLFSASPAGVVPASGPAVGGQMITVNGTNFPLTITAATPLTATLGGLPLTNITPVGTTSFTATTPAKAASTGQPVSVTTAGGTASQTALYNFVNGITVSPNTVPTGVSVDVDIQGTGFATLPFDGAGLDNQGVTQTSAGDATGTNSANAHVYLVQGTYNPAAYASGANKTVGQASECVNPAVISDTELICTVNANASIHVASHVYTYTSDGTAPLANGSYTVTIVGAGDLVDYTAGVTFQTVLSSGATFTVADF
jgi:hypothetical protein